MVFERAAELVDISERVYRQVFAIGIWVAASCSAVAIGTSLLQPTGQLRGVIVCAACLAASLFAALRPAAIYRALRLRPWLLLIPGALLGLGAFVVGQHNLQLFLPVVSIIGAIGVAVPIRVVMVAGLTAASGLGAPQLLDGPGNVGGAVAVIVPPLMYWLIVERIARFTLRLHQSLERSDPGVTATPGETPPANARQADQHDTPHSQRQSDPKPRSLPEPKVITVKGTQLTSRQLQVILLACEGLNHAEIGVCLDIRSQQVGRHLREACRRTGSTSVPQLVAWARRTDLVPERTPPRD